MNVPSIREEARGRLVPWLPENALRDHVRSRAPETELESRQIAIRAVELGIPDVWVETITLTTAAIDAFTAAQEALRGLDEGVAAAVFNSVLDAASKILAPPTKLDRLVGTVAALPTSDDQHLSLRTSDAEVLIYVPTNVPIGDFAEPEKQLAVDAFVNACDELELAAIVDEDEVEPLYVRSIQGHAIELSRKEGFHGLLAIGMERSLGESSLWTGLATVEILPRSAAEATAAILEDVLARLELNVDAVRPLLAEDGFACYPDLSIRVMNAALAAAPKEAVDGHSVATRLLDAIPYVPLELVENLAAVLNDVAEPLRETGFVDEVSSRLNDLEGTDRGTVLALALGPVDPGEAAGRAVTDLRDAVDSIATGGDEAVDAARSAVRALRALTRWSKPDVRHALGSARYSPSAPELAAELLAVYDAADALRKRIEPDFIRIAGGVSREAASIALRRAEVGAPLDPDELEAVLSAASAQGGDPAVREGLSRVIDKNSRSVPKLEQLGVVALSSSPSLAEAVASEIGMPGVLERRLFSVARNALGRDVAVAERRLQYAEAWREEGRNAREIASKEYEKLLREAQTPAQLRAVLESLLRFFPTADQIPAVGKLRNEGLRAVERIQASGDANAELSELVQRAIGQLRWNVSAKRSQVRRVLRKFGL
jgi:hypothetical protein